MPNSVLEKKRKFIFLQTEDEFSAGYYTLGAVMTGKRASMIKNSTMGS